MSEEYLDKRYIIVKRKMIATICLLIFPIILMILMEVITAVLEHELGSLVFGLRYFLFVFLESIVVYKLVRYTKMVKNRNYLRKIEIHRLDERNQSINLRASSLTLKTLFYVIVFSIIIFGFIDIVVFYTLLFSLFVVGSIYIIIKYIYTKKI